MASEIELPPLPVPEVNEASFEKGARFTEWLNGIRNCPADIRISSGFVLSLAFYENTTDQCAVVFPSKPIPSSLHVNGRGLADKHMPPVSNPFLVDTFEYDECFLDDPSSRNTTLAEAHSPISIKNVGGKVVNWWYYYQLDPSEHKIAIIDGWKNPT